MFAIESACFEVAKQCGPPVTIGNGLSVIVGGWKESGGTQRWCFTKDNEVSFADEQNAALRRLDCDQQPRMLGISPG